MDNLFTPLVPVLLVGAPGVGKTASVRSKFDYAEILLTSTLVEEDIAGLPYRDGDYDYRTVSGVFRRLQDASDAGKTTVLFLDELDKARRAVADTLLTLVASRQVGIAKLPENTCIVAAANPPEFGGGDGISDAMLSRFSTVDYVPDVHKWADWAQQQFNSPAALRILASARNGEMPIFDMTGEGLNRRITTPRTLTMALHAMDMMSPENFETLLRGLLTPATASQILHIVGGIENDVLEKSTSVVRRSSVNKKANSILRL